MSQSELQMFGVASRGILLCLSVAVWGNLSALARSAVSERPQYVKVEVDNDQPRRDERGHVIDAHDGCLKYFAGRYYLYGTAYGKSAGYGINNRFRVYSSQDLKDWSFDGE